MRQFLVSLIVLAAAASASAAEPLVIYSAQKEPSIRPLLDRFTAETGTEVQLLVDQGPVLVERLAAEGANTRADLLLTVDAGNLWQAAERGLLAPAGSAVLDERVPAALRDAQGRWYAISRRARAIVYSTARVKPANLSTYEALAGPQWKGRLCLRTSKNVYNQSLVATRIARMGEPAAEAMVRGWVANLAATPLPDDTLAAQAVAGGECDVAVTNMYYVARLKRADPSVPLAMFWPDQDGAGAHQNIAGMGIAAHARNPAAAKALLEWITDVAAQTELSRMNLEYPVNAAATVDPLLAGWGAFKSDDIDLAEAGRRQADAVRLMDRAGWR
jgi:iron(III) transport system substrate-binding protein